MKLNSLIRLEARLERLEARLEGLESRLSHLLIFSI
jgi:BMFP domain-containing protein YqiC